MRLLIIGVVLLAVGVSLSEYNRRTAVPSEPSAPAVVDAPPTKPTKPTLAPDVAALVEVQTPGPEVASAPPAEGLLAGLAAKGAAIDGFAPLLKGDFHARQLGAGYGFAVLAIDVGEGTALVRLEPGEPPALLTTRAARVTALLVDASTLFFAEGGHVFSMSARGEAPTSRALFPKATVTSLGVAGGDLLLAVVPTRGGPGAVLRLDPSDAVTVVASEQKAPSSIVVDGAEVFWLADGLWRGGVDGSFSARISEDAVGPLALDGGALVVGARDALWKMARSGGKPRVLAELQPTALAATSGLVTFADATGRLLRIAGGEPEVVATLGRTVDAVALGGPTSFILTSGTGGAALLAK